MPWRMENGVKVFEISAEHVRTELLPGRPMDAWGFNGSVPGPTIEVNEGDRVRLIVTNNLPEPYSMHWHGLEIPVNMDGMPGISQPLIQPGQKFVYEFTLHQNGTFFYHSHMAMQEMMGLIGMFIIHPKAAHAPHVDRDFGLVLQEWALLPNNTIPNSLAMEFNWLTLNGKAGPATTPLLVKLGERVRVRFVNLGMDHHPMHLHGNTFYVTGTEAGRILPPYRQPENTVLVGVAQSRDIEFDAKNPGDWMLHCHLPHHMMNQMVSMVGPLMAGHQRGMRPGEMEPGMGIAEERALGAANGPRFGRTIGTGAESERGASHLLGPQHMPAGQRFPGFPQDMFMVMDDMFKDKPETYDLAPGWTGGMMGMMTLVRVLEPALFDRIEAMQHERAAAREEAR
ncbi:MAG: copper oxidase [Acidobacteriota bacterium]|nr:copper oxidase [Acidobacteriota bacterium]